MGRDREGHRILPKSVSWLMTKINSDERAGLALAALALTTATLAAQVREGDLSLVALREILRDAHRLANDVAGFVVDEKAAEMADDFLSMAEALAMPDAPRVEEPLELRQLQHKLRTN
jgi:hypothetical protein